MDNLSNQPPRSEIKWDFLGPPQQTDEIGRLAQYRILKPLGQGGMGIVFQAEDQELRRLVALKVMRPDCAMQDQAQARFLREARTAASIKHDHVVTIHQVGEDRGVPFLAMEFLTGKSLDEWLRPDRRASVLETLAISRQIAKGLGAAHTVGLVHRDIKPANIWLESPSGRVKILDFGLARHIAGELTQLTHTGDLLGTPAFMAPEQVRGEAADHRSDLFSFGCVLYRMVTGRLPFQGNTVYAVLHAITSETPPDPCTLNPATPPRLAALIAALLDKAAERRPTSAETVLAELLAIGRDTKTNPNINAVEAKPKTIEEIQDQTPSARPKRKIIFSISALVALACLLAAGAILKTKQSDSKAIPTADLKQPVSATIFGAEAAGPNTVLNAKPNQAPLATGPEIKQTAKAAEATSGNEPTLIQDVEPKPKPIEEKVPENSQPPLLASSSTEKPATASEKLPDKPDHIKIRLSEAISAYGSEMEQFRVSAREWFDKREETARKRPGSKLAEQIQTERTKFEESDQLPKGAPATLIRKLKAARAGMEEAYSRSIKEYAAASKRAEVSGLEKELAEFRKKSPPRSDEPQDALQAGTVWVGKQRQVYGVDSKPNDYQVVLEIIEREEGKFKAKIDIKEGKVIYEFEGFIDNKGNIQWSTEKNIKAIAGIIGQIRYVGRLRDTLIQYEFAGYSSGAKTTRGLGTLRFNVK